MSFNLVTATRFVMMATAIILVGASIASGFTGIGPSGLTRATIIGGTMIGLSALSFIVHLAYPAAAEVAWDEMNMSAHNASLVFGYWATLAVFLVLLIFVLAGGISAEVAFYWMGPVLGIAPSVHFLSSVLRGHAD
ncbi:hypothetical protein ROE7235_01497 [Roseibaca ekhonensis]|jgi:hypothetical protein|uniref:Uncharacterized protein n=1 Tax=Roseinatronobacter ekhonensis TaxID=254356 RepID=A0A3B0MKZ7_9RHOB|nr:hypothetical protein [Roseibaca ekhonensis]SUZ31747.1 hypothetical protein ROE7235_01497 [Roseibaca ekhonensis]